MKKWTLGIVLIEFFLFVFIMKAGISQLINTAVFREEQTGDTYSCQMVKMDGEDTLFLWDNETKKCSVVSPDSEKGEQLLGTAAMDTVYYQSCYPLDSDEWMYELFRFDPEEETFQRVIGWQESNSRWLALDGDRETGQIFFVKQTGQNLVEEYVLDSANPKRWELNQAKETGSFVWDVSYNENHELVIQTEDGKNYQVKEDNAIADAVRGKFAKYCGLIFLKKMIVLYLIAALLAGILILGMAKGKSIVIRMLCTAEIVLLAVSCGGTGFVDCRLYEQMKNHQVEAAGKQLKRMVEMSGVDSVPDNEIDYVDIVRVDVDSMKVSESLKLPVGASAAVEYGNELEKAAAKAVSVKGTAMETIYYDSKPVWGVAVYDWTDIRKDQAVIGLIRTDDVIQEFTGSMRDHQFMDLLLFAVGSLILMIVFFTYQGRWKKYLKIIEAVALDEKDFPIDAEDTVNRNDGMHDMWNCLMKINDSLEQMKYNNRHNYIAYSKFAPAGLEKLFEKERISEIQPGTLKVVPGTMVQIAADRCQTMDGRQYMDTVDRNLNVMKQLLDVTDGIMIHCDSDFLDTKCLFRNGVEEAIGFAVGMSAAYRKEQVQTEHQKLFLIHKSDYCCGLAGTEEYAVPFAYAKEDEILDLYKDALRRAGVRIVITESALPGLKTSNYGIRYIGYISGGNDAANIRLYECLDAYSDVKRKLITHAMPVFEEALKLFYSDDFYLARNTFNKVLQMNPTDQIARWYLFNCEYYLNTSGNTEISYGLFENQMLEQQYQR